MPTGLTETILAWKSRGLSNGKISPPTKSNDTRSLKLKCYNSKIRVEFKGSCLKQNKLTLIQEM